MQAARPGEAARDTGLPPGVQVGPLGRRFLAHVVDSIVPAAAATVVAASRDGAGSAPTALVVGAAVVGLAWGLLCWQQLAVRAASPGMRLTRLQLVGFFDGRPVRWGRVLVRWLVFAVLSATGIGLLLLIASILISPRHQGWHDRAVRAVVIVERPLAPTRTQRQTVRTAAPSALPVAAVASGPADAGAAPAPGPAAPVPAYVPTPVAGDPAVGPELAPVAAAPAPDPSSGHELDPAPAAHDGTHRTIFEGWVAELDDGREVPVRGLVLIGRNPQPEEGEDAAELVKLADDSRTVSKTHLALGVDDAGLFVVDRGSTNGSTVTAPGREAVPAGAFHAMSVGEGAVVSIGDHWLRIRRES